jgi:hypothetical protein
MKLEIWIEGSLVILLPMLKKLIAIASYVLKIWQLKYICDNSKRTETIVKFIKLKIWIDVSMEIMHVILSSAIQSNLRAAVLA